MRGRIIPFSPVQNAHIWKSRRGKKAHSNSEIVCLESSEPCNHIWKHYSWKTGHYVPKAAGKTYLGRAKETKSKTIIGVTIWTVAVYVWECRALICLHGLKTMSVSVKDVSKPRDLSKDEFNNVVVMCEKSLLQMHAWHADWTHLKKIDHTCSINICWEKPLLGVDHC